MNKRTRLFLLIAAGILIVGLGTGLVASYVGLQNLSIIGGKGPAEFAYVPADARLVAYANVRQVMDSELRHKLDAFHPGGDGARTFQEQTGIDIEKDIDYLIAAGIGEGAPDPENMPPLVLAHGHFDPVRLEALARKDGGAAEDYKGKRLVTHDKFAVAFIEPGLVAVGGPDAVRKAIDTKAAGNQNVTDNADLMRLVRDVDDGTVWAVAKFDAVTGSRIPREVVSKLPAINWFSAKGVIGAGVDGQVRAETRDEMAAQDLRQVIQGFMALARMQGGSQAGVSEFINSLQLGGQGKTVSLSFSLPPAVLDALGALRAQQPRAPSAPVPPPPPAIPAPPRPPSPPAL